MTDARFWHEKWEKNEIGFHEDKANPLLVKNFNRLSLAKGSRVLVPLCGKTLDISWLLSHGYDVAGIELSKLAVSQLFAELEVAPKVSRGGKVVQYRAKGIDIFCGNLFDVSRRLLGPVDAIYDRAALVALPENVRRRYTAHLMNISGKARQMLICYQYDQTLMEGPPFSISDEEVNRHYGKSYDLTLLTRKRVSGGIREKCPANESVWLLEPRRRIPR
jgi:thiopurine S-methyltransferase